MLDPRPAVRLGPSEDQRQHGSTRGAAPVRAGSPRCGVSVVKEAKASFHFLFLPSACASAQSERANVHAEMRRHVRLACICMRALMRRKRKCCVEAPFCSRRGAFTRLTACSASPLDELLSRGGVRAGPTRPSSCREADVGTATMQHQHPSSKSGHIVVEIFRPNAPLFLRSARLFTSGPSRALSWPRQHKFSTV